MAASRPTYLYQYKQINPYALKNQLGALADALGCFPFDTGPSRPMSDLPSLYLIIAKTIKNLNSEFYWIQRCL